MARLTSAETKHRVAKNPKFPVGNKTKQTQQQQAYTVWQ